jgi:hypothetical protein
VLPAGEHFAGWDPTALASPSSTFRSSNAWPMVFAMKHPRANNEHHANHDSNVDTLLQELTNRVQELNDFTPQGLNGQQYRRVA